MIFTYGSERPPTSIFFRFFASKIIIVSLPAVGTYLSEKQMSPSFSLIIILDYFNNENVLNKHLYRKYCFFVYIYIFTKNSFQVKFLNLCKLKFISYSLKEIFSTSYKPDDKAGKKSEAKVKDNEKITFNIHEMRIPIIILHFFPPFADDVICIKSNGNKKRENCPFQLLS